MPPPKNFSFSIPEEWLKWFCWFQGFRQAPALTDKRSKNQVIMLVYTMGDAADDILFSFSPTDNEKKNYDTVVEKFE